MTAEQIIEMGRAQAMARMAVVEAAYGVDTASLYAAGMAVYARDYMVWKKGDMAAYDWFVQLADQSVNSSGRLTQNAG